MSQLLIPQLSEKNYHLATNFNTYVFKVNPKLSKAHLKDLLQAEYKVAVVAVRTANFSGKRARSIHLKSRSSLVIGRRKNWKKAYVTLKSGDSIPVFTDFVKENQN